VIALILPAALMLSPAASHASAVPSALFAAQARAAHLSATQQAALRREVNKIIARYGGRQIALNEIALPHDSSVLFPLPGQRVARVLPGTPPLPVNKAKIAHATKAARLAGVVHRPDVVRAERRILPVLLSLHLAGPELHRRQFQRQRLQHMAGTASFRPG
jgi:hypothetical protein